MRKALYILGTLNDSDIDWMSRKGTVETVPADAVLIEEGRPIDRLYILLDGELSVRVGGVREGQEVARLLSGEVVGEISFVDSRPPSASVVATHSSFVLALDRLQLAQKLESDGLFAARFYRAIATFLADRLYVTVGRLGYGSHRQDDNVDQIDDHAMDDVSVASLRFDQLLKKLRGDYRARAVAARD